MDKPAADSADLADFNPFNHESSVRPLRFLHPNALGKSPAGGLFFFVQQLLVQAACVLVEVEDGGARVAGQVVNLFAFKIGQFQLVWMSSRRMAAILAHP